MQNSNKGMGTEDMLKMMQAMKGAGAAPGAVLLPQVPLLPHHHKKLLLKLIMSIREADMPNSNTQNSNTQTAIRKTVETSNTMKASNANPNIGSQTKYEDHIQKAVDSAVDRLLTKTKERRAAEERKKKRPRGS